MWRQIFAASSLALLGGIAVSAADLPSPLSSGTSAAGVRFTVREQPASLCEAGTRHWTGSVEVGNGKNLFFWFFQSRSNPTKDPVVTFLQGGPAASSMMALFSEVGPCSVNGTTTQRVETSWANNANLLFVDQPAGVGFSTVTNAAKSPVTLATAAPDFNLLMTVFYESIFPSLAKLPLHITGESFGGRYVPAYVKYILEQQKTKRTPSMAAKIDSIILVSGLVDFSFTALGHIDHFCSDGKTGNGFGSKFSASACNTMKASAAACERAGQACRDTYDLGTCRQARTQCGNIEQFFQKGVKAGGNNPYDDRLKCSQPPACRPKSSEIMDGYLNTPAVQAQLGFTPSMKFQSINFPLNQRWSNAGDPLLPSTRDLKYILSSSDIRILILNGNNDVNVNTAGNIRAFDALPWAQQDDYRKQQFKPWYFSDASKASRQGGLTKGVERLLFVGVDNAGHDVPAGQPEACLEILTKWFVRGKLKTAP